MTALVLIPFVLALIWMPALAPGFALFVMFLAVVGAKEFADMAGAKGVQLHAPTLMVSCALLNAAAWWGGDLWIDALFVIAFGVIAFRHIVMGPQTMAGAGLALFGLLYMGWLPTHFVTLHMMGLLGPSLISFLIAVVALADSGAYFAGRTFGKHKLAPVVSPNKTWEGVAGGALASIVGTGAMLWMSSTLSWFSLPGHHPGFYFALTLLVVIASIVGDLLESMLKRDAGVKDSGTIFPGHGGVLDRCDGMLLAGPVLYYCLLVANG